MNSNINSFRSPRGRQSIRSVSGCRVIDDSYNANPVSARSALKTLGAYQGKGRRIFVCGDMLELGGRSKTLHQAVGQAAVDAGTDFILSYGSLSRQVIAAAKKKDHSTQCYHFQSLNLLNQKLKAICRPGDVVLIKGSRGMGLERTVAFLHKNLTG